MTWLSVEIDEVTERQVVEFKPFSWWMKDYSFFGLVGLVGLVKTYRNNKYRYVTPLIGDGPSIDHYPLYFGSEEDRWRVVPPDQWSDELCVAMATRALEGEQHGD